MDIRIDLTGHKELIQRYENADRVIKEETITFVNRATGSGARIAQELVGVKTGHLRRSITAVPASWAGGTVTGAWGTNVPYARMHEEGTGPHVIVPKNAKALRFTVGGETVFARRVRHPGTKPRHYMKGSKERIERGMQRNAETLKARIVQRMSGGA